MLYLMGSALAFISFPLMLPVKSVAKSLSRLPGFLSLPPLHHDLTRQAISHVQSHQVDRYTYQEVQIYLCDPDSPGAQDRIEHQIHQDFIAGRVAVVDGWLLSETEVTLLAMVK